MGRHAAALIVLVASVSAVAVAARAEAATDGAIALYSDGAAPDAGMANAAAPDGAAERAAAGDAAGPDVGASAGEPRPRPGPAPAAEPAAPVAAEATPAAAGVLLPLRGTVLERGTRLPVAASSASVDGREVETDLTGTFEILVPPGRHSVRLHDLRYEDFTVEVTVAPPHGLTRVFRVSRRTDLPLYESRVRAHRAQEPGVTVAGDEARSTAGTSGDPFRVLPSLPGVAQLVWPLALYAIRGANPGNTGFFVDDMRVPALFHLALGPSIIHPYLIGSLKFFPGGYPASYSGYVSGIVAATTAAPPEGRSLTSVDVRLYDAGALVARSFDGDRGTVTAAARYSYAGLVVSHLSSNVSFGYADYQLRVEHPLAGGRATLLMLGSYDQLDVLTDAIGDAGLSFHRARLGWSRAAGPGTILVDATVGVDNARSTLYGDPISVQTLAAAPRLRYRLHVTDNAELEAGVDGEWSHFDTQISGDTGARLGTSDLARPRPAGRAGAYLSLRYGRGETLQLVPALRLSDYLEEGVSRQAFEPRLTARLHAGGRLWLNAAAGAFAQMPSLPLDVAGFEGFGLRDYGLQRSAQGSVGVEVASGGEAPSVELTGFYQALRVTDLNSVFERTVTAADFLQMRPGRAFGAELLIRRDVGPGHRLHGWLAYTLSWSERSVDGVWGASDWDQRHILNLLGSYDFRNGSSFGARFHYNSGRPFPVPTPAHSADYQRLPAFYQLDIRADKRWVFDRWWFDVYVELGNATLTRNVVSLKVTEQNTGVGPMPFQRTVQESGFRLVLPAIGVHAEF